MYLSDATLLFGLAAAALAAVIICEIFLIVLDAKEEASDIDD